VVSLNLAHPVHVVMIVLQWSAQLNLKQRRRMNGIEVGKGGGSGWVGGGTSVRLINTSIGRQSD